MVENFFTIKQKFFQELDDTTVRLLLKDKSTRKNIIWATDHYISNGVGYQVTDEITLKAVKGYKAKLIKPRVSKSKTAQAKRVKNKAEVFTPSWVCNNQNNLVDTEWFGRSCVFNQETSHGWVAIQDKIEFPEGKTWMDYVDAKRLEITCGEAPYIVSLYDSVSGEYIPFEERIGLLDRKIRIIEENVIDDAEWNKWITRAFQSVYGYEFQGDNLLLARENIFYTYIECYRRRFGDLPSIKEMRTIANIIAWNIWQMDGLKGVVPLSCLPPQPKKEMQISLFHLLGAEETKEESEQVNKCPGCQSNGFRNHTGVYCKIMDWRGDDSLLFVDMIKGDKK